jgi:predicted 2-oxoglutarate/Fe(II)-dependent dioxygenase YbiX
MDSNDEATNEDGNADKGNDDGGHNFNYNAAKEKRKYNRNTNRSIPTEDKALNLLISKHKYVIFRQGEMENQTSIVRDRTAATALKMVQKKCEYDFIFQQPEIKKLKQQQDNRRLQWEIKDSSLFPGLQAINKRVRSIMKKINRRLKYNKPSLLHSKKGCMRQAFHYDHNPELKGGRKSFGVIVFLEDGGKLIVLENHGTLEKTLLFNKGDILVFRSDLVHAGAAYTRANSRLHYYFDAPGYKRRNERFEYFKLREKVREIVHGVAKRKQIILNRWNFLKKQKTILLQRMKNFKH